jgi:hypothetical protein
MDDIERAILSDVVVHDSGCWTWKGQSGGNVIRLLAALRGAPLPVRFVPHALLSGDAEISAHWGFICRWLFERAGYKTAYIYLQVQ